MGRRWLQISERNLRFLFGFSGSFMVAKSSMMCMNMNRCFENFVGMTMVKLYQPTITHYDSQEADVRREALANLSYHIIGPFRLIANSE